MLCDDTDQQSLFVLNSAMEKGAQCTVTLRNYRKNGSLFYNELTIIDTAKNIEGEVEYRLWGLRDVTKSVLQEKEARFIAYWEERIKLNKGQDVFIDQHLIALKNLTSSFGQKINSSMVKLSPREMEVCSLVRNGMVNKEIAHILNISVHTVEKHRRVVRKKLGIANMGINLHTYLNSL